MKIELRAILVCVYMYIYIYIYIHTHTKLGLLDELIDVESISADQNPEEGMHIIYCEESTRPAVK